ncbi:MAG: AAA family ATPase [Paraburkholderia fungorum]|nr:AAA family ATPase [Paraburkholderia fungorum]
MNGLVVISGCSGGGKSTLLAELAQRGYAEIETRIDGGTILLQGEHSGRVEHVDCVRRATRHRKDNGSPNACSQACCRLSAH